jgi:transglutaminase-like putative cysteine protease
MDRTPTRLWDFPSAALLILILLTTGQRLYITHWAPGLGTAIILTLIGVVLGLALGFSIFKLKAVFWLAFGYSIPIVILVLGWFLYRGISWLERIADLSDRLAYALGLFLKNQPVQDTILFVVFMALVFWIIGLIAGYAMTRFGNFIGAVVPAGVVLVTVQLYDSSNGSGDTLLAVYFILCLLLLGRLTYVRRQLFWKEQRVSTVAESRTDLNITLAVVAVAAVLLVWLAPTSVKSFSHVKSTWENLTRPLREIQNNLGHAVAGLQVGRKVRTVQVFGDTLPLGHQAATGESVYLRIQTPLANSTVRYYWRVRSYNIFLNDQWYAENGSSIPFSPDQSLIALADPEGLTSEFTFTAFSVDLATLVTPARPVWVSYPSKLFFLQVSPGKMDPIQFQADTPVLAGEQYNVRANKYEPTILQLRGAGEIYPDWVADHYLQLPSTLSPEIAALAQRITSHAKTPYEMAAAITNYLRGNITYASTVEDPPPGKDPLDWFLFDSKHGFCNYYATAEVILLRAVGIPARMVIGFAQGEFAYPDHYVVRQRDLHAWPEVYFPGVGWVEFEPTTSQPPIERPVGENLGSAGQTGTKTPPGLSVTGQKAPVPVGGKGTGLEQGTTANLLLHLIMRLILICIIIVTILAMYTFGTINRFLKPDQRVLQNPLPVQLKQSFEKRALTPPGWLLRWAYLAELNPVERSFMTVYRILQRLGEKASPSQTPAEAAEVLSGLLPGVSNEIDSLLDEYQNHLYSHKHGYLPLARRAVKIIRREAWRVTIQQRWMAFQGILMHDRQHAGRQK